MKHLFQTLPWDRMDKRILKFGVLIGLVAGMMMLSCKKDNRQELFELNYPPPPIEFDIPPGLNTFDTHIYTFSPLPTQYLARLAESGHKAEEVIAIEAKDAILSSLFQDENLYFIHRVSIYIFDPFNPADKAEFLYLDPVPLSRLSEPPPCCWRPDCWASRWDWSCRPRRPSWRRRG